MIFPGSIRKEKETRLTALAIVTWIAVMALLLIVAPSSHAFQWGSGGSGSGGTTDASALTTGTVNNARLPATISQTNVTASGLLNGNALAYQATANASLNGTVTVTIGSQFEYDPILTGNSVINLALAGGLPSGGIIPLNLRACQDATGGRSLTINGPGGGTTLSWNADGGSQPQPSQSANQCSLYRLTYRVAATAITEDSPMLVASPAVLAAVEACAAHKWLNATSTTGGGSADCAQPTYADISGSNPAFSATNSVGGTPGSAQPIIFVDAPAWMRWLGDATEADPGPNSFSVQGTHFYAALTINSGQTITVTNTASSTATSTDKPNGVLVAFVQGACTIAGTINASGIITSAAFGGGAGGGGGFGASNGTAGNPSNIMGGAGVSAMVSGGIAGTSGVAGGNAGPTPDASEQKMFLAIGPAFGNVGGGAGSSGNGVTGGTGIGGGGGGGVMLICGSINFTGTINVSGANGGAGGANIGGGGGGGGGVVLLSGRSVTNSGTINVAAGSGGAIGTGTSTAGGNGSAGWSKVFTLN